MEVEKQAQSQSSEERSEQKRALLFICTANAVRSQMAEGLLKSKTNDFIVYSAGSSPVPYIDKYTVQVMKEIGIDVSSHGTNSIDDFKDTPLDIAITLCGNAYEVCPRWLYQSQTALNTHWGFKDAAGRNIDAYRKLREELNTHLTKFVSLYSPAMTREELRLLLRKFMR